MDQSHASRTAEFMALFRALETTRDPAARLFADPFARSCVRPALRAVVTVAQLPLVGQLVPWFIDWQWPGARTSGIARTRLIDDELRRALLAGIGQVVILGAGFDCRAYRLSGIERARVFEVDHPATSREKQAQLRRHLGTLPAHVTFVTIDFNTQDLAQVMRAAGFSGTVPAFFIWEGVTNYLTAEAVDATLAYVRTAAAPGSRLVFTYIHRGVLDGSVDFKGTRNLASTLRRVGEPWTFGIHPAELPGFLGTRGLQLVADIGATEYRTRYMGEPGRRMQGYDFYRTAVVQVAG